MITLENIWQSLLIGFLIILLGSFTMITMYLHYKKDKKKPNKEKQIRVRFAPSPTGGLHFGGIRTAIYNYLYARKHNGKFILRIEDTDQERFNKKSEDYIYKVFKWLGIEFDESPKNPGKYGPYRQSERKDIYKKYAFWLVENGFAYFAFDTQAEIQARQKETEHWTYNSSTRIAMKNSLTLRPEVVEKLMKDNTDFLIRLKLPSAYLHKPQTIISEDSLRGKHEIQISQLYDLVLWKKSTELPTYHLASVVDDHLMEITHIIRGAEWLSSLPYHTYLYDCFGWKKPIFVHASNMLNPKPHKGKISKRDNYGFPVYALQWEDIKGYKEEGFSPEAFMNFLVFNGWNPGTEKEIYTIKELIDDFTLERLKKSDSRFSYDKAVWFNKEHQKLNRKQQKIKK